MSNIEINIPDEQEDFLFKVKSRFNPLLISLRYPLQISVTMLILIFMLPEVETLVRWITGIDSFLTSFLALAIVFALSLIGPLLLNLGKYYLDPYIFYQDRVEFTTGVILREKAIIHYNDIKQFKMQPNIVQKQFNICNLKLTEQKQAGSIKIRKRNYIIHDIKTDDAKRILKKISEIISINKQD